MTPDDQQAELRETSSATTRLILGYVRAQAGDAAVADVLARADLPYRLEELESESRWVSYDARIRLMTAAVEVLHDPSAMFKVGGSAIRQSVTPSLVLLLRALGSPAQVFRQLPRAVGKFTTTSTMRVLEANRTSAVIRYELHDGFVHSRLDCSYAQGLFSVVPEIFGLPPAHIVHDECESDGADACVYHVTWARRSRWRRRVAGGVEDDTELTALRGQLETLESAATDLVSSDDLEAVLSRIVERAASAVLAQGYLLAVRTPDGGTLVRAAGVDPDRTDELAAALLEGRELGTEAVVVDVESTRARHGRLAALYPPGQRGVADEGRLLGAYAGHAAAALDMISALEDSRRGRRRADALLQLSRQLATTTGTHEIAQIVTAALPEITECTIAGVWLWDESTGRLRTDAAVGLPPEHRQLVLDTALGPHDVPELAQMLTSLQPVLLFVDDLGPVLRGFLTALELTHVIAVPLLASGELLGIATVSWASDRPPIADESDLMLRLSGVADHTSTALQNARLVSAVRHQALHDALTGLPNRVLFTDRLEQALRSRAHHGVGVLFCDLDRFKAVNDALGHAVGDDLLRQVADRVSSAVREADSVGRLSGDEFAVLLPDVDDLETAVAVAQRVSACFDRPFRVEGKELRVTMSVGVSVHLGPDGRVDQLLRSADAAMYDAKQRGRNHVSIAPRQRDAEPMSHPSLESELVEALDRDQLLLAFQPIVDVATGNAVGAEALIRWSHPRLGMLTPASFLPMAEETQLVVDLDSWVIREACRAAATWSGPDVPPLHVSVNLSGRTLADPRLVSRVRDALRDSGLPADRLELEIVESRALLDVAGMEERLHSLRHLGVRVALDDFGTGYSTLSWLQTLPVDRVKVDRSFTARIDADFRTAALVRGVVALSEELGLDVVAEGVETPGQLAALRACGVGLMQGYLLGPPAVGWQPVDGSLLASAEQLSTH